MDSSTWSDSQALAYIASYADLRRVLGSDPAAGRAHYAQAGATEGRTITFDALAYTASYSDLISVYRTDTAAATRHYIQAGAGEGRTTTFDALTYIASYSDLISTFRTDTAAATRHYIQAGAGEGRTATFDALTYIASYSDLISTLRTDTAAATRHYIQVGAGEGRTIKFDALAYIASHSDLISAFRTDTAAATRHYIQAGAGEGRAVTFDALAYIASYSDLISAFRTDTAAATRHYIQAGAGEGRTATFDAVNYLFSQTDLLAAGFTASQASQHWINAGSRESRSATSAFGTDQVSHSLSLSSTVTGAIGNAGDRDWFGIELVAGRGVSFDYFPSNGNGVVTIYSETGRALPPSETVGARTSFIPPESGTYYVVVSTANSATGAYTLTANDVFTITGTFGADTLTGTDGADALRGLEGEDTLNGRGGNDVLEGGQGNDRLNGGLGNDTLYGNNAANTGFDLADSLTDDFGGNDQLFGQDGGDFLSVSRQTFNGTIAVSTVLLDGGNDDDSIYFSASNRFLDTVTVRGGLGNDTISVGSVLKSTIDAGDGNDKITIGMSGGDQTITLGAGADVLTLDGNTSAFAVGNPTRIVDFQIGTDKLAIDQYLGSVLLNWDKLTNPFATGHLRLVQSGSDTLFQLDRDGSTGTGYGLSTLLTLGNTTATAFTAQDFGYAPDGSVAVGLTITGTIGADTLTGTDGADVIRGLDGGDTLSGRGGNDVLEGGSGYDQLNGGLGDDVLYGNNAASTGFDTGDNLTDDLGGNDQLFGQEGGDYLNVSRYTFNGNIAASTVLLDGGNGDDTVYFSALNRFLDTVTVRGGAGNDTISVGSVLKSTIDAGDGNDKVNIGMSGGDQTITLGAGTDMLTLDGNAAIFAIGNPTRILDFQTGNDTLDIDQYIASVLVNWDKVTNPFATGHLKLVQSGSDTLFQLDRDGSTGTGYALSTLLTLGNATATAFTGRDIGYAPDGSVAVGLTITGTFSADTLRGTESADVIRGLEGSDTLNGRGGNDVLEGGGGFDQLNGGLGDDVLYGNNAANTGSDAADNLTENFGGNDQLFGQDGNDFLSVSRSSFNGNMTASTTVASTLLLDGGNDDDSIYFSASSRFLDTVTVRGGAGNDTISVGSVLKSTIDAGDGNDKITIGMSGGNQTITLGAGTDVLTLDGNTSAFAVGNPTRVVDFQIGTDKLDIDQYLASVLVNWDKLTNPFDTGHLKLVQSGNDTLFQIDRDGSIGTGDAFATLLTLGNTTATAFTAKDFGYAPDAATNLTHSAAAFELVGHFQPELPPSYLLF